MSRDEVAPGMTACLTVKRVLALSAVFLALLAGGVLAVRAHARTPTPLTPQEQAVKDAVRGLLQREDAAAASGDKQALPALFDLTAFDGRVALAHAEARLAFVGAWAAARGVRWLPPLVTVRTPRIRFGAGDPPTSVQVTAIVSEAWTYQYSGGQQQVFGLGREHYMTLTQAGGAWRIAADSFTDPLDQDTRIPGPATPGGGGAAPTPSTPSVPGPAPATGRYNRAGAVRYADTYCGAAPGCGNGGLYNPGMYDYNGDGGDCTNFISQALRFGGGLRESGGWAFDRRSGEGTDAWAKAPDLVDYLTGNGLAQVAARGGIAAVWAAVAAAAPGDLIAYVERGTTVHMAVITARDPMGYALVNSHTADRYHVPWDIGWDQSARFVVVAMTGATTGTGHAPAVPVFGGASSGCGIGG